MKNGAVMTMLRKYFLHKAKEIYQRGKIVSRENKEGTWTGSGLELDNKASLLGSGGTTKKVESTYRVFRNWVSEPLGPECLDWFMYLIYLRHFVLVSLYESCIAKPVVEAFFGIMRSCLYKPWAGSVPAQSWRGRAASNTNLGVGNPPENHKLLNQWTNGWPMRSKPPQTHRKGQGNCRTGQRDYLCKVHHLIKVL